MLLSKVNVIFLTIFILVSCEEHTKEKEYERHLTKRQIIYGFQSNPTFYNGFDSRNPDHSLVNKFGHGSHPEYVTENGGFMFRIYMLPQFDYKDYNTQSKAAKEDNSNDTPKHPQNFYFKPFYRTPENEVGNIKVKVTADHNKETLSPPEYNFTTQFNLATYDDIEHENESLYAFPPIFSPLGNTTYQTTVSQKGTNEVRTNSTHVPDISLIGIENINNMTKETKTEPTQVVNNITVNNKETKPIKDLNSTLYISNSLENTATSSQTTNLIRQPIPDGPMHINTSSPKVNTLVRDSDAIRHFNIQSQLPKKKQINKVTPSQNINRSTGSDFLENLISNFVLFFNNTQSTGSRPTNKNNRLIDSHLVDIPRNRITVPQKIVSPQSPIVKNVQKNTEIYNSGKVPKPDDFENMKVNNTYTGISEEEDIKSK